jgi:hypothetical protein
MRRREEVPADLIRRLAAVYRDPDQAYRRTGGLVCAVDQARLLVAVLDRLDRIERSLRGAAGS